MTKNRCWRVPPRVPSPEMREAGQAAARAHLQEAGDDSLDAIWQAMWDQAPSSPRNGAHDLLVAVSTLAMQSGSNVGKLIDWMTTEGGLMQMFEAHFVQPNDSTRLQFLLPLVTGGPQADAHTSAVAAAVMCGKTGMDIVDAAMGIAQAAAVPRHPGYLIRVGSTEPACYLGALPDEHSPGSDAPTSTRDTRHAHWYPEERHAEQVRRSALRQFPGVDFQVVDLPVTPGSR